MSDALARFVDEADVSTWTGLPHDAAERLGVDVAESSGFGGLLGEPPSSASWIPLATRLFTDGLRAWIDDDRVVLLEGAMPERDGGFLSLPDLGEPELSLDFVFGPLTIVGGERVYASRGLAVCVNPRSGVLLALRGFAPTTADDYRRRLRVVPEAELRPAGRAAP